MRFHRSRQSLSGGLPKKIGSACLALALVGLVGVSGPAGATAPAPSLERSKLAAAVDQTVPNPIVEGPITGGVRGYPWNHTLYQLTDSHNYREDEYFLSGTATYLTDGSTAAYKSRMLVRLPRDRAKFNGIVLFDWMNVTDGADFEFNYWPEAANYLMDQGYGYVAVSAQLVGVSNLLTWDSRRYAGLVHPGDNYSFDIFSQAIQAMRNPRLNSASAGSPRVVDPTNGLHVRHVVAGGVSQSAGRLATFINGGYNRGGVDAYNIERALGSVIKDYSTFIFELNEETSFTGAPAATRPPDSNRYVVWEEAGAAHETRVWWDYRWGIQQRDQLGGSTPDAINTACSINRGRVDYSVRAMIFHTRQYLLTGKVPPSAPRIKRNADNAPTRDADGLAIGGLRYSFVQVPIALNRSTRDDCPFWGTYQPWTNAQIRSRYPTHADYVKKVSTWDSHAVAKGWLLAADRAADLAEAKAFTGPWSANNR